MTPIKRRGRRNFGVYCRKFAQWIHDCGLIDMGFSETKFTWERGGVKERLDRALCNAQWRLKYEEASVLHLP